MVTFWKCRIPTEALRIDDPPGIHFYCCRWCYQLAVDHAAVGDAVAGADADVMQELCDVTVVGVMVTTTIALSWAVCHRRRRGTTQTRLAAAAKSREASFRMLALIEEVSFPPLLPPTAANALTQHCWEDPVEILNRCPDDGTGNGRGYSSRNMTNGDCTNPNPLESETKTAKTDPRTIIDRVSLWARDPRHSPDLERLNL